MNTLWKGFNMKLEEEFERLYNKCWEELKESIE